MKNKYEEKHKKRQELFPLNLNFLKQINEVKFLKSIL